MAGSSGLRVFAKSGEPAALDEAHLLNDEPQPPARPEPRFTRFMPAPRGRMKPVVGSIGDKPAMQALALSGGGWLHEDGRLVSNGSCQGTDALRVLPATVPILDRLDGELASVKTVRQAEYDARLARHLAQGKGEEEFYDDDADQDYAAQIAEDHPGPDVEETLARAGWIPLDLRRDRGVKEIRVTAEITRGSSHEGHLTALVNLLDCRLHKPLLPELAPAIAPDPFAGLSHTSEQMGLVDDVVRSGKPPVEFDTETDCNSPKLGC